VIGSQLSGPAREAEVVAEWRQALPALGVIERVAARYAIQAHH
jgi:hypothetical protein